MRARARWLPHRDQLGGWENATPDGQATNWNPSQGGTTSDLANQMLAHGSDLRVFMRQAAVNPDIWARGSEKSQATAERLRCAVLEHPGDVGHEDPELAIDVAFRMMYCTTARRITHGPHFAPAREVSDGQLVGELSRAIADYLV